jgi:hypothetical protein
MGGENERKGKERTGKNKKKKIKKKGNFDFLRY